MKEVVYKERLNSIRNEMTHLWTSFFIVAGGSLTILFNNPGVGMRILAGAGILLSLLFLNAYIIRRVETLKLLKELEEEK